MLAQVLLSPAGMHCDLVLIARRLGPEGKGDEECQERSTEFFFTHIAFESYRAKSLVRNLPRSQAKDSLVYTVVMTSREKARRQ